MDALKSLMQPLVGGVGGSGMIDGMKLVVLGGTVETARRMSSSAWSHFVNSFFLTAHFSEDDYPYDWLMLWLSRQPEWQRSREFETTTRTSTPGFTANSFGDAEGDESDEEITGKAKTRVVFQPTFDSTHTIFYRGHWLRVRRSRDHGTEMELVLFRACSVVARSNLVLKQLVLQAKKEYEAEAVHRIQIYFADSHGAWRWADSRHKRPMSSVVLNPGVKEMLIGDTKDFLKSEKWYADRGIPFRRGYLLHGVPGSGKSSLIHALAGEIGLDIYTLSLSSSWISDATLTALMGRVPARCIVLLEDLDAAFTRSTQRDAKDTGTPGENEQERDNQQQQQQQSSSHSRSSRRNRDFVADMNTLSLSGLLNALDGVAASEGRLLFATTNHLERLDPALSRPGRMDVWIEFKNASKWQAEALFRNFFPSVDERDMLPSSIDKDDITLDAGELAGIRLPSPPPQSSSSSGASSLWNLSTPFSSSTSSLVSWPGAAAGSGSSPSSSPHPDKRASGNSHHRGKSKEKDTFGAMNQAYMPPPVEEHIASLSHSARPLDSQTLARLAKQFADSIPEDEFSVAALQGYLLKNKSQPEVAAKDAAAWVVSERELRERLQREKEAKEQKEKEEREKRLREGRRKQEEKLALEKKEAEVAQLKAKLEEEKQAKEAAAAAAATAAAPAPAPSTTTTTPSPPAPKTELEKMEEELAQLKQRIAQQEKEKTTTAPQSPTSQDDGESDAENMENMRPSTSSPRSSRGVPVLPQVVPIPVPMSALSAASVPRQDWDVAQPGLDWK